MDPRYNNQITSMSEREPCLNCQHPRVSHQGANGGYSLFIILQKHANNT
jgi:hypothetical protein